MNCNTTHYRANSSSVPGDPTEIVLHTLYRFEETAVLDSGRIQGFLKKAGTLCHTDKLMAAGLSV